MDETSIRWAVEFLLKHSDGDLFPKILELEAINDNIDVYVKELLKLSLTEIEPQPCRRFLVPKDELSYRQATQLAP